MPSLLKNYFIYLALLGLHCYMIFFSSSSEWELLSSCAA